MSKPVKAFITYSHKNKKQRDRLEIHLAVMKKNGELETWYDGKILAGSSWENKIAYNLNESNILIYLVSADSLASQVCDDEIIKASNQGIKVIPVILEECHWKGDQQIVGLQVLPEDGKPISTWTPRGKGWQYVVDGIRQTIEDISEKKDTAGFSDLQAGNTLMIHKHFDQAINKYESAIALNPDYAEAYGNRGVAYAAMGEHARAIEDYDKAIALSPDYADAYKNRSSAYEAMGEPDRAIADLKKAIELNPNLFKDSP